MYKELLEYIVKNLVSMPDKVNIEEIKDKEDFCDRRKQPQPQATDLYDGPGKSGPVYNSKRIGRMDQQSRGQTVYS